MTSNGSCLCTPPLSPITVQTNNSRPQNRVARRRQPQNLRIQTNVSEYMEKIMENTSLICSFLKTVCVGMPVDEESMSNGLPSPNIDEEPQKKKKPVSIENFVANILIRTKLGDTFVYVALHYIKQYLKMKLEREEAKKMEARCLAKQDTLFNEAAFLNGLCKKGVYLPKNSALKMSHSKRRHSISKCDTKVKISQQSLNYLYQQSKKTKKEEVKKNDSSNIVEYVGLPKKTLIRTQKDLIFAAMICSSKYLDDNSYCNSAWVKLTDKSLKEVFALEREFLMSLEYKLYFKNEEWRMWFIWILRFKAILDSGMTSGTDVKNKKSPSCMVSIPSQTSLPSPIEIQTPTSATFTFDNEEIKEEMNPVNYPVSNNNLLPTLSSVASFAGRYPSQVPVLSNQQYLMACNGATRAVEHEQFPVYQHCTSFSEYEHYGNFHFMEFCRMQHMKRRMAFVPEKVHSSNYLSYPAINEIRNSQSYLLNNIDTSLISQAQNTPIDFNEVQELTQKQNITFKKPILRPCTSSTNDTFDVVNLALKLAPSKNTSSHSSSGFFIPTLY